MCAACSLSYIGVPSPAPSVTRSAKRLVLSVLRGQTSVAKSVPIASTGKLMTPPVWQICPIACFPLSLMASLTNKTASPSLPLLTSFLSHLPPSAFPSNRFNRFWKILEDSGRFRKILYESVLSADSGDEYISPARVSSSCL